MTPTVRLTAKSAVAILLAKFDKAGIEPREREYKFKIDDRDRDRYPQRTTTNDLGAGIRPVQQPLKRKYRKRRAKAPELEAKIPFVCKYCGKPGLAKTKRRELCDNNNECNRKFEARKKAAAARGKAGE